MTPNPGNRDPVTALENQDERLRRDFVKAARFVVSRLRDEQLREFIASATTVLREFKAKSEEPHVHAGRSDS